MLPHREFDNSAFRRARRLFRFLNALGSDVEIRVIAKPESDAAAKTRAIAI